METFKGYIFKSLPNNFHYKGTDIYSEDKVQGTYNKCFHHFRGSNIIHGWFSRLHWVRSVLPTHYQQKYQQKNEAKGFHR